MNRNIVLCGVGGQGILLSAKIIASAAELTGFEVTTHEIHGMAQRGGSVTAQIRYGRNVHSPLILEGQADVLASLEACEALRFGHYLRPGGLAVVSSQRLIPVTVSTGQARYPENLDKRLQQAFPRLILRDFCALASGLGDVRMSNTIMLGALAAELAEITTETWNEAIKLCLKPAFLNSNLAAFQAGAKA
ncbi:MAG: indolepyruvate oxidoreductase subunit beta [Lentisphaerae bacterium ADurb.Bin082]|nr:MAG: indolepyruvate oxidoreductase subunit beta [Lentisphaerae bacterium ADurb.Bin082]